MAERIEPIPLFEPIPLSQTEREFIKMLREFDVLICTGKMPDVTEAN